MVNMKLALSAKRDPAVKFLTKSLIDRLLERDPVDVQNELELLCRIFGVKTGE